MSNEKEKSQESSLLDFNWDESGDFFTNEETTETVKEEVSEEKETTVEDENTEETTDENNNESETEEVEKTEEEFSFGETTTDEETEEEEDVSEFSYLNHYKKLKENGILSVELEEDKEDLTEEEFLELTEKELQNKLEEEFKNFSSSFNDEAKAFLRFVKEGGSSKEFFKFYSEISEIPDVKEGNEKSYEKFMRYYHSAYDDMDQNDIDDKIEWLKETGKLESYALKYNDKIQKAIKKEEENRIEKQKLIVKKQQEERKRLQNELSELTSEEELNGWVLGKEDKKLPDYLLKPTVKVGNQHRSQFQVDLQEALKDKNKLFLLAKILKNDFDISDQLSVAESKTVKNTKKTLRNNSKKNRSSKRSNNKSLSDFF